ncbi:hypothetical protein SH528x_003393 [Novipirellula sp. SH528]|uniref:hypothetical protein n=1 Tax=Novipirellula sp. SH528 TaxID=3454466 RepID=UPI003F9F7C59
MPKQHWTPEKVIEELRRVRRDGPRANRKLDDAARRCFGSVRAALEVAGLPCGRRPTTNNGWSKDTVIEAIRERHRNGESLWQTHHDDRGLYEAGKRCFGTWTAARAAAGFPKPTREFYSPDEVRLAIIDLYERELPLTFASHRDSNLRRSAIKHFGGWRKAVESLGLGSELPRRWTKQSVVDAILERRASGHWLFKTCSEDKRLFRAGIKHFGSWEKALQAAGIHETARQRWNEEKVIARLRMLNAKHPGDKVRRHDSNLACAAEKRFGTLAKALQAAGLPTKQTRRRAAS